MKWQVGQYDMGPHAKRHHPYPITPFISIMIRFANALYACNAVGSGGSGSATRTSQVGATGYWTAVYLGKTNPKHLLAPCACDLMPNKSWRCVNCTVECNHCNQQLPVETLLENHFMNGAVEWVLSLLLLSNMFSHYRLWSHNYSVLLDLSWSTLWSLGVCASL